MEARGNRTHFEDLKYGTLNWKYGWTVRTFYKSEAFPSKPMFSLGTTGESLERPSYYSPNVLAFLCSSEQFVWEIEVYDVNNEGIDLSLDLARKVSGRVKGLGIPNPTTQTVRIFENFVPLDSVHQQRVNPVRVNRAGYKYWEESEGLFNRRVEIQSNPLGLSDINEYQKQWEHKAHGMLLDMAVYIE